VRFPPWICRMTGAAFLRENASGSRRVKAWLQALQN
jgi:hypothetical protein